MEPFNCHEFNDFLGKPLDAVIGTCVLRGYTNVEKVSDMELQAKSPHLKKWVRISHRDGKVTMFGLQDENSGVYNSVKEVPNTLTRKELEPFLQKDVDTVKKYLKNAGFDLNGSLIQRIDKIPSEFEAYYFTDLKIGQRIIVYTLRGNTIILRITIENYKANKIDKTEVIDELKPLTRAELEPFLHKEVDTVKEFLQKAGFISDGERPQQIGQYRHNAHFFTNPLTNQRVIADTGLYKSTVIRIEIVQGESKEILDAPKLTRADLEPFLGKAYLYMSQELQKKGYARHWDVNQNPKFVLTYSDDTFYYIIPRFKEPYDASAPVNRIELYDGGKKEVIEADDAIVVNGFTQVWFDIIDKMRNENVYKQHNITARTVRDSIEYAQEKLDALILATKSKA